MTREIIDTFESKKTGFKITIGFVKQELCITLFQIGSDISSLHLHVDQDGKIFSSDHNTDKHYPLEFKGRIGLGK